MGEVIKVGMADLNICKAPDTITTLGLGSCIGIALLDPVTKIGGLAHIMLPDSTKMKNNSNIAKFADTGIVELVRRMTEAGAAKSRLVAKIAGGARMFEVSGKYWSKKCRSFQTETEGAWYSASGRGYRAELWPYRRIALRYRRILY